MDHHDATHLDIGDLLFDSDDGPPFVEKGTPLINIWKYFNPWATDWDFHRRFLSILNDSEDKPKGVTYVLIDEAYDPQWRQENVFYARARLHQLPDYAENKALLVEQHTEPSVAELERRMCALLTENTDFRRYGLEDGPDMEIQDEYGNCAGMLIPGEWMPRSYELPEMAWVDTPPVKYVPAKEEAIAVFSCPRSVEHGLYWVGWFVIAEIELFAAQSLALSTRARDKKWNPDLNRDWAAIKLRKLHKGDNLWAPAPAIEGLIDADYYTDSEAESFEVEVDDVSLEEADVAVEDSEDTCMVE